MQGSVIHNIGDLEIGLVPVGDRRAKLFVRKAKDEKGIIYRLTAVLYVHDYDILRAMVNTTEQGQVQDEFEIESQKQDIDTKTINMLLQDFEKLFLKKISVMDYLQAYPEKIEKLKDSRSNLRKPQIQISESPKKNIAILRIKSQDRPGLLFAIAQVLYILQYDILSIEAGKIHSDVDDIFYIRPEKETPLNAEERLQLLNELQKVL